MPYVDAARAAGFRHARIMLRHMLPNVMAPYLIMVTSFLGQAILLEASLSFLGLGVQEPTAAWGLMLRGAAVEFAETAPWMAIFPGLAISLAVFAFNLFGDSCATRSIRACARSELAATRRAARRRLTRPRGVRYNTMVRPDAKRSENADDLGRVPNAVRHR